jgi:hypothetical protein
MSIEAATIGTSQQTEQNDTEIRNERFSGSFYRADYVRDYTLGKAPLEIAMMRDKGQQVREIHDLVRKYREAGSPFLREEISANENEAISHLSDTSYYGMLRTDYADFGTRLNVLPPLELRQICYEIWEALTWQASRCVAHDKSKLAGVK